MPNSHLLGVELGYPVLWIWVSHGWLMMGTVAAGIAAVLGGAVVFYRRCLSKTTAELERFHSLNAASPVGMIQTNSNGVCLYANPRWLAITGRSEQDVLGREWTVALHSEDRDAAREDWARLAAAGESFPAEYRVSREDGTEGWVRGRFAPLEGGGWLGAMDDVTGLVRSERERRGLASIVENSRNEIYFFDAETLRFQYVNEGGRRNMGYSLDELRGMTPFDIKPDFDESSFRTLIEPLRSGEKDLLVFETRHLRRDGSVYPVEVSLQLSEQDGRPVFVAIILDIAERRRAEAERDKFFTLSCDPLCMAGPDGVLRRVNPAYARMLGLAECDLVGKPWLELVHPDDREKTLKQHEGLLRGEPAIHFETRIRCADGTYRTVLWSGSADAETGLVFASGRDITELKQSQAALETSYATVKSLQEALDAHSLVSITDQTGRITYVNDKVCDISKFSREELLGADHRIVNSGYHSKKFFEDMWQTIGRGEVWKGEIRNRAKDGSLYWVDTTLVPFLDSGGKPYQYIAIRTDITRRKRMEDELRRSQEKLQLLLDSTSEAIYGVDLEGRCTFCNPACLEALGYQSPEDLLGKNMLELAGDNGAGESVLGKSLRQGEQCGSMEGRYRRADGTVFPVEISSSPQRSGGDVVGAVVAFADITERKQAEANLMRTVEELSEARRMAEEANRSKSEFLANMSHEIRTPMNSVMGMSSLLLESDLTPEQHDFVKTIHRGAEALLSLLNDILDFSKIEAGKLDIDPTDCVVEELVEDCIQCFAEQAGRKGLELTCMVAPEVPAMLRADAGRLRQILVNLVGNAVKFTNKGEIGVAVTSQGTVEGWHVLRFEVKDTGIGIPPGVQERLFQAFTQADGSTTRRYGGTGLGLAISRSLTELMGGSIGVESNAGRGSSFWLTIPFEEARDKRAPERRLPADIAGIRVLAVDDNETNREILGRQFRLWKASCDTAENGMQAISMIRGAAQAGHPYGVIVMDYGMPEINGADVTRLIKVDPATAPVPVVMLTSYSNRHCAAEARQAGVHSYLTKPVRKAQLLQAVLSALGRQVQPAHGEQDRVEDVVAVGGCGRILLCEDNLANQRLVSVILKKAGFACDVTSNGLEALAAMEKSDYPLVLMDCQMPEMDGFQATAEIRRREGQTRRTPIIALTAYTMQGDRQRCLDAGMDDYMAKPLNAAGLLRVVRNWLKERPGNEPGQRANGVENSQATAAVEADPAGSGDGRIHVQLLREMRELIPDYLAGLERDTAALRAAVARGDLEGIRVTAHGIKGSGGSYGLHQVSQIGRAIEEAALSRDTAEIQRQTARLAEYLERLEVVFD